MDIKDVLHIYNAKGVVDRKKPSEVAIAWSNDGTKSILFINQYSHAVGDTATSKVRINILSTSLVDTLKHIANRHTKNFCNLKR